MHLRVSTGIGRDCLVVKTKPLIESRDADPHDQSCEEDVSNGDSRVGQPKFGESHFDIKSETLSNYRPVELLIAPSTLSLKAGF